MSYTFRKTVEGDLDYELDYSEWLGVGEAIISSEWTIPATIIGGVESFTDTTTTIKLSGGTLHQRNRLLNTIVTSVANMDARTVIIDIVVKEL